jgi:hypothetical protein
MHVIMSNCRLEYIPSPFMLKERAVEIQAPANIEEASQASPKRRKRVSSKTAAAQERDEEDIVPGRTDFPSGTTLS